jgi:hypothetical protein
MGGSRRGIWAGNWLVSLLLVGNGMTPTPVAPPLMLTCPTCLTPPLEYVLSFVSGATPREQWDEFVCPRCDRVYEYGQQNGDLRLVLDAVDPQTPGVER